MKKMRAIIVDLDGTFFNIEQRRKFLDKDPPDWDSFNSAEAMVTDQPNKWCVDLVKKYMHGHKILFVTGRFGTPKVIQETRSQIIRSFGEGEGTPEDPIEMFFGVDSFKLHCDLCLRKSGDFRKDSVIKKEIYENYIKDSYEVQFCVDDRQQVVDMWRSLGLVCLQCDKGDF